MSLEDKSSKYIIHRGFTLVEVLISIALIGVIGSVVFVTFVASLKGSQKTAALATVRQNGDYAMNQMTKNIRFSEAAVVAGINGSFATYCVTPAGNNVFLKTLEPDGSQTTYSCNALNGINISSTNTKGASQYFLDTTKVALVPNSCSFSCTQTLPSDSPIVSIQFSLTQANNTSGGTSITIPFRTSVLLRNFQR